MTKPRILIADDSEKLLIALKTNLERHGYVVEACTDAYMALACARRTAPDVMVLDIRMPAGNGFSVMERMEKIPELKGVPVIYMTGAQSAELELQAQHLGASALIHKPISFPKLLELIDAAADSRRERSVPSAPVEPNLWEIPDPRETAAAGG